MRFLFWSILLLSLSCSQKVVHFVNDDASFKTYQTFLVVNYKTNEMSASQEGKLIFQQIADEVSKEMEKREYQVNAVSPDLLVRYELISNQVTTENFNNSMYPGFFTPNTVTYRTMEESALFVEIMDTKRRKLVWQASLDMNNYTRQHKQQQIISEAVDQLFDTYLYRANSNRPDNTLLDD